MIATASFSRGSIACKQDGSQVANGVPRFEAGKFGQAIMVEEGTTKRGATKKGFIGLSHIFLPVVSVYLGER